MRLCVNKSFKWFAKKLWHKTLQKSIKWFQWMMRIPLLIITTKDGYGFNSLGAQLMSTLTFPISWNCFQVEAARAVTLVSISQPPKKMNWRKLLFKFFMQLSRDLRRLILTVTNHWINHKPQVLSMPQWRKSLQLVKNLLLHLQVLNRSQVYFRQ